MTMTTWSEGSRWLRWDPHLHSPGTLRNNQFGNDWDGYIQAIEQAQPAPVALGITDYFTLRGYKEVMKRREKGVLAHIPLIFPNIELRLTIETKDHRAINAHFLVSPEDPDHVAEIEGRLGTLVFTYKQTPFFCNDSGLIKLGRAHKSGVELDDETALQEGANQFKVELSDLRKLFNNDMWMEHNVYFAVAGGKDGLGGLSADASFHAQREELGRNAHFIFSAAPKDRSYWLGQHADFAASGLTPKPCLHGSDAHGLASVLAPDQGRNCWIRAEATFDGLRQTMVEPERRVHIGEAPPEGPLESEVIRVVRFRNGPWLAASEIRLNDGLVTIIGAKGSGKTALADLIAHAADAAGEARGPASFVVKAEDLLDGLEVELEWGDGQRQTAAFPHNYFGGAEPQVRYLSQQFVEQLCAPGGITEPLLEEVERVVFSAIPEVDRFQCLDFFELRALRLEAPLASQGVEREAIWAKTQAIADEQKLRDDLPNLEKRLRQAEADCKTLRANLAAIPTQANEKVVAEHRAATEKLAKLCERIQAEELRAKRLGDLEAAIGYQIAAAEQALAGHKAKYAAILAEDQWALLRFRPDAQALAMLQGQAAAARSQAALLRERGEASPGEHPPDAAAMGLAALEAEVARLAKALGLDQENAKKRIDLDKRLAEAVKQEQRERQAVAHAQAAQRRQTAAMDERLDAYAKVFEALAAEEEVLAELYQPLRVQLEQDPRLRKLSFSVHRQVDLAKWATRGEALLDLRKPPFQGQGALEEAARQTLLPAWKAGDPAAVRDAMKTFVTKHGVEVSRALATGVTRRNFGEWLFSTDHIDVRYGIKYEGVDLSHLSPGTRGVVLLTLYLALDQWDTRPLLIDQPEENLDPGSVFLDLVPFFRDAAKRRQVIMVTHNANLVVNTDSDQVIVAAAERTSPEALPRLSYVAGGLEDRRIREHVCRLLEGGARAFKKREERYRGLLGS